MNKELTEVFESAKKVSKGEYVFSNNGKPSTDVKTGWWTALKRAGIEDFRFHDLRHTFGARLGMKGLRFEDVHGAHGNKRPEGCDDLFEPQPGAQLECRRITEWSHNTFHNAGKSG